MELLPIALSRKTNLSYSIRNDDNTQSRDFRKSRWIAAP